MRNFLLLFLLLMPVIGSCTDDYDDSAAWKDIDGIYKDLDQLKAKQFATTSECVEPNCERRSNHLCHRSC